jgi:hypothetical protein
MLMMYAQSEWASSMPIHQNSAMRPSGLGNTPQHRVLFGMAGAGKLVIIADLLAQIGHEFGFRLIVEEGLSHAVLTQTQGFEPVIVNPNGYYYAIAKVYEPQIFRLRNRSYAVSKNSRCPEIVLSKPMWPLGNGLKHRASQPITNGCCHVLGSSMKNSRESVQFSTVRSIGLLYSTNVRFSVGLPFSSTR